MIRLSHQEDAARAQAPVTLGHHVRNVGDVVEHAETRDEIEGLAVERHVAIGPRFHVPARDAGDVVRRERIRRIEDRDPPQPVGDGKELVAVGAAQAERVLDGAGGKESVAVVLVQSRVGVVVGRSVLGAELGVGVRFILEPGLDVLGREIVAIQFRSRKIFRQIVAHGLVSQHSRSTR